MIKVNVFTKDKAWKKYFTQPEKIINRKLKKIHIKEIFQRGKHFSFSLLLAGNKEIKILNKKFRKKNKATDILSFPFYEKKSLKKTIYNNKYIYLGDIIININKIKNINEEFSKNFDKLWIHGFLHLLGYKHKKDKDFLKMQKLENSLYKKVN